MEGTRLYLVHACRCCLVTERKQIEGRKLERMCPYILFIYFFLLFLFLLLDLPSSKIPIQATRTLCLIHTHTHSCNHATPLRFTLRLSHLHTAKTLLLISSQDGCCPPVRKTSQKGGQGEARGEDGLRRKSRHREEKIVCKKTKQNKTPRLLPQHLLLCKTFVCKSVFYFYSPV